MSRKGLRIALVGTVWALALGGAGVWFLLSRAPASADAALSSPGAPRPGELKVLFIGNSFTAANDMPLMVVALAAAAHERHVLYVHARAPGGSTLADHAADHEVAKLLSSRRWDYVVLQEQSLIPSIPSLRSRMIDPGAELKQMIDDNGARTALYATWGYENGDGPGDSFTGMEERTEAGYQALATALAPVLVVPVGRAFATAEAMRPGLDLWYSDGMHPSVVGSYLAACVFFDSLYHRQVAGNTYTAGLPASTAALLQRAADAVS